MTESVENVVAIKEIFEQNSVLNLTYEIGTGKHINFLDVHVDAIGDNFITTVYSKPTRTGIYLNANSECPQRYKDGTVKAIIHRTYKISST